MAVILNIETSNTACSVALTAEGMILRHHEDLHGRNHAALLSDYIKAMLDFSAEKEIKLEAIAVSLGPGSYTGLRIGLSEAKGLAYGLNIPLIGLSSLKIMATHVMFELPEVDENYIFIPMLDARRMEVYTAAYDIALNEIIRPQALILTEENLPYDELLASGKKCIFFGNGMPKWREALKLQNIPNAIFIDNIEPLAIDMLALAERAYHNRDFIDTAYSTPIYLKDFQATKPRNRVIPE